MAAPHPGKDSRDAAIGRARKLLKLASSPNTHEAARAGERARELMARHGLTAEDVAESVIEEVNSGGDEYRAFLVTLASALHGCTIVGRRNQLAFRGRPTQVRRALAFYNSTLEALEKSRPPPVAPWLEAHALAVWRFCWWDGFAAAVYARFPAIKNAIRGEQPPAEAPRAPNGVECPPASQPPQQTPSPQAQETRPNIVDEVKAKARDLANCINVDWLSADGHRAGRAAGERAALRLNDNELALPQRSA